MENSFPSSRIRLALALVLVVAALMTAGCQRLKPGKLLTRMTRPDVLRVGIVADAPPLAVKKQGVLMGLETIFADGLAAFEHRELELVEMPRQELARALVEERIDIAMAGLTVGEARAAQLATCTPYLISGQVALVHLDDLNRLGQGTAGLAAPGVRIGVVEGSPGEALAVGLKPKGAIRRFAAADQGVQALISDQIDVFIDEMTSNFHYAALHIDKGLTPGSLLLSQEPLAWAVRPDNDDQRQQANAYLEALQRAKQLDRLLEEHIPFYHHSAYGLKKP